VMLNLALLVAARISAGIGVDWRICGGIAGGRGGGCAASGAGIVPTKPSASGSLGTISRILRKTSLALSRALFSTWMRASSLSTLTVFAFWSSAWNASASRPSVSTSRGSALKQACSFWSAQIEAGELAHQAVVLRLVPEQTLGDLHEVVLAVLPAQLLARVGELLDRVLDQAFLRVQLGELDARRDVLGVEIDELLDRLERFLRVAFAMEVRCDALVVLHRLGHAAELAIQLGELQDHVDEARIELEDLVVDRDRFEEKPLLVIEARDLEVRVGRFLLGALLRVEVADLEPDADVLRILVDDPQVLLHRFVDLALIDKFTGCIHDLFFIQGHELQQPPAVNCIT
jgi:hypothetical protein